MCKQNIIIIYLLLLMITNIVSGQSFKDYYPLHVGDYWIEQADSIYGESHSVTFRADIEGTDIIRGNAFFRMKQKLSSDQDLFPPDIWYVWLRPDSNGIVLGAFGDSSAIIDLDLPVQTIIVDGNATDWSGISPLVTDPQGDDSLSYTGDDIKALYGAQDVNYLYLRLDLWDNANINFQNGPPPYDGKYTFQIDNDGPYEYLELGIAYDIFNYQWSLGYNGSNGGDVPQALEGPSFVGVNGNIIELKIPLNLIGNPTHFNEIQVEVSNYNLYYGSVLDEAGISATKIFDQPYRWLINDMSRVGSSWEFNSPDWGGRFKMTLESISETIQVPAGTFNNCAKIKELVIDQTGDTTQIVQIYFARGVGEVFKVSWTDSMKRVVYKLVAYSVQSIQVQTADTARAGENLTLSVIPSNLDFQPTIQRLYYRSAGNKDWHYLPLSSTGTAYQTMIPPDSVTIRGIEYYIYLSDGQREITYPELSPQAHPAVIKVAVDHFNSPVSLPDTTFKMISVPLELKQPGIQKVLVDDFGPYDRKQWRLFRWQNNDYAEFTDIAVEFKPGMAFWAITRYGKSFDIEQGLSIDSSEPYSIVFQPGWNQVANPFAFPLICDSIVVQDDALERPVYYNGREYQYDVSIIQPWEGYFVFNKTDRPVQVKVSPLFAATTLPKPDKKFVLDNESECLYQISAEIKGTKLVDTQNYIGLRKYATEGRDELDFAEAPPIGDYVQLSIVENGERFAGNFKSMNDKGQDWKFEVSASIPNDQPIIVTIQETGRLPQGHQLFVLDQDYCCAIPIAENKFELNLAPEFPVRHFKLILGTEEYAKNHNDGISLVPIAFVLKQNYPNPFNSETTIQYQLGRRSRVTLSIYNMLGQKVRTLVHGLQNTGYHSQRWDGLDESCRAVASGVYVVYLKADDFTATNKLLLIR